MFTLRSASLLLCDRSERQDTTSTLPPASHHDVARQVDPLMTKYSLLHALSCYLTLLLCRHSEKAPSIRIKGLQ